jgi:hypothetical protein
MATTSKATVHLTEHEFFLLTNPRLAWRFWSKVQLSENGECYEWQGGRNLKGYGMFGWFGGTSIVASRASYEINVGPIPEGLWVLHRCDNRGCVRPDHLFLGTNAENVADKMAKGRQRNLRGEQHPNAKLRAIDIPVIRALGDFLYPATIAGMFGVSREQVGRILKGTAW